MANFLQLLGEDIQYFQVCILFIHARSALIFSDIYRDMRHPYKYNKAVDVTYIFTYLVEVALAIAGYIMFGEEVRDEITANIFLTKGYPKVLSIIIMLAIAIIPLTKIPLK